MEPRPGRPNDRRGDAALPSWPRSCSLAYSTAAGRVAVVRYPHRDRKPAALDFLGVFGTESCAPERVSLRSSNSSSGIGQPGICQRGNTASPERDCVFGSLTGGVPTGIQRVGNASTAACGGAGGSSGWARLFVEVDGDASSLPWQPFRVYT